MSKSDWQITTFWDFFLLFTSSGSRWAVRLELLNVLYRLIRHWYLVKWKCNTVHHEGMFIQERWTPQSLHCGMSPCSQKSKKQKVSHFLMSSRNALEQIKKWTLLQLDQLNQWMLSLSFIPFQMVNLQRVVNPLLYLVLTAICIYLTVEVPF